MGGCGCRGAGVIIEDALKAGDLAAVGEAIAAHGGSQLMIDGGNMLASFASMNAAIGGDDKVIGGSADGSVAVSAGDAYVSLVAGRLAAAGVLDAAPDASAGSTDAPSPLSGVEYVPGSEIERLYREWLTDSGYYSDEEITKMIDFIKDSPATRGEFIGDMEYFFERLVNYYEMSTQVAEFVAAASEGKKIERPT